MIRHPFGNHRLEASLQFFQGGRPTQGSVVSQCWKARKSVAHLRGEDRGVEAAQLSGRMVVKVLHHPVTEMGPSDSVDHVQEIQPDRVLEALAVMLRMGARIFVHQMLDPSMIQCRRMFEHKEGNIPLKGDGLLVRLIAMFSL